MSNPLRILLCGCGGIVNAHLPAFKAYPEKLALAGICDPSASARAGVLEAYGKVVPEFEAHEPMFAKLASQADAALIVTPHFLHHPQAVAALESGLPCLIEKPITNNLAEARALHALSQEKGLIVMAGQTRRYNPWARYLRDWVGADAVNFGQLSSFSIEAWQNILCWIATKPDKNADFWILDKERAGGGVVVSLGCHTLDLVRYLSGDDYAEVSAQGVFEKPFKNGAESACCATLKMKSGAVGTLHANYLARRVPYSETFKLYGTRGSIVQHSAAWGKYEGEVRYGSTTDDNPPGWEFQYEGLEPVPKVDLPGYRDNLFTNQLLEFHRCVTEGREPLTSVGRNLNTMAVIEAIYTSMNAGGATVKVEEAAS